MKIESTQWVSYSNHSSEQVSPSNNFHQLLFSVNIQYLPLPTHCQYLLFTKPYFKSIFQNKCHWWNIFNLTFKFTHFEGKCTFIGSWLPANVKGIKFMFSFLWCWTSPMNNMTVKSVKYAENIYIVFYVLFNCLLTKKLTAWVHPLLWELWQ